MINECMADAHKERNDNTRLYINGWCGMHGCNYEIPCKVGQMKFTNSMTHIHIGYTEKTRDKYTRKHLSYYIYQVFSPHDFLNILT